MSLDMDTCDPTGIVKAVVRTYLDPRQLELGVHVDIAHHVVDALRAAGYRLSPERTTSVTHNSQQETLKG
jgi:hypothetical protein